VKHFSESKSISKIGPKMDSKRYKFFIKLLDSFIPPGALLSIFMPLKEPIEPSEIKNNSQTLNIFPNLKTLERFGKKKISKSKKNILRIADGEDLEFCGLVDSVGLPFSNLKKINMFEEGNPDYRSFYKKNRHSWFRDSKTFLQVCKDVFNCEISYIDSSGSPSVENYLEKVKINDYQSFFKSNSNFVREGEIGGVKFVKQCLKEGKKISVLVPFKGLGHLFCQSCKEYTKCPICKKVLVLNGYELRCVECDDSWPKISRCDNCGDRLKNLKKGLEHFLNWFLMQGFSREDIEIVSSEETPKEAKKALKNMKEGVSKVLLTTNFEFLRDDCGQNVIWIPYVKYLFVGDDFRSQENGWWKIHAVNNFCLKRDLDLFFGSKESSLFPIKCFEKGEFSKFYRDEIEVRKQFDYPPFGEMLMIISEKKIKGVAYEGIDLEDFASDLRYIRSFDSRGKEKNHTVYIFQSKKIEKDFKKFIKNLISKNQNIRIYYEGKS